MMKVPPAYGVPACPVNQAQLGPLSAMYEEVKTYRTPDVHCPFLGVGLVRYDGDVLQWLFHELIQFLRY